MPRTPIADTEFLKKARERFKLANEADSKQAQRERDDIAFEAGDQWPADIKLARMGQQPINGMPSVPARPTLTINKVKEPVRQILNQERASDIGIEIVPADDFGDLGLTPDDTEITLREGLVRRIQRESIAADARTWAFKRAVIAGRGYYLVMTKFLPGKTWDQDIYIHRIYNQAGVLLDPSHERPDGSDADWGFIGTWMPWDRYQAEYGTLGDGQRNPFSDYSETDFMGMTEQYPDWYKAEGEERAVRVVDYWYTERTSKRLAVMEDGTALWEDEVPDGVKPADVRTVVNPQIKFCKIGGGVQKIEETDWDGPDMPIVKVLGDEILPYDGERRAEGVVRPARDAQMGENSMISKFVETVGLAPISPLIVDPEAIDQYEPWYAVSNTRALPYLPSRTYDDQGRQLKEPHRPNADPNILPMAQGIALFDGFIQNTTGGSAPDRLGVGQRVQANAAIKRLQDEEQFNTSNFLDNLARSVRYEGQIVNNLLYPIYGAKPGRLVRALTGEGDSQMFQIGDPQQPGQPGQAPQAPPQASNRQKVQQVAKLTKDAHFNVIVKIARSQDNRRSQFVGMFGEILSADPSQMMVGGDLFYKNMDIPEAKQLAERQRVMLAPPIQKMLAEKDKGQKMDPAAQAEIAQLQERVQMAEQAMQQLAQAAEGKQIEAQSKLQIAQLQAERDTALEQVRAQTELEKARMDNATKIHVAEIAARTKGVVMEHEREHEAVALAHEAAQADLDRLHETGMAASGMAHDAALGEGAQAFEADEAERGRTASAEEAERARQAAVASEAGV